MYQSAVPIASSPQVCVCVSSLVEGVSLALMQLHPWVGEAVICWVLQVEVHCLCIFVQACAEGTVNFPALTNPRKPEQAAAYSMQYLLWLADSIGPSLSSSDMTFHEPIRHRDILFRLP